MNIFNFRLSRFSLLVFSFSIIGMALVLARETVWGPVLTWDSIYYINKAENLLSGNGFISSFSSHSPLSDPPFYPILIALASLLIFEPRNIVGLLNAVVFGLTILVTGRWMWQRLESRFLFVWGTMAVMLAMPLTALAALVLTEAPFILFVTLSLVYVDKFLDTGDRSTLVWSAAFALIVFLTRSLGISVIILVLFLLLTQRGVALHEKFKYITIFGTISIMPLFFLYFSSYEEEMAKMYSIDIHLYLENLGHIFAVFRRWIFLEIGNGLGRSVDVQFTEIMLGSIALFVLFVIICRSIFMTSIEQKNSQFNWRSFKVSGGFVLVYSGLLIKILPDFRQAVEYRFVAPIYIPCLLSILLILDRFFAIRKINLQESNYKWLKLMNVIISYKVKLAQFITLIGLSLWLISHVPPQMLLIREYNKGREDIIAYSAPSWSNAGLLNEVRQRSFDGSLIYSNNTAIVYFYADQKFRYGYIPKKFSNFRNLVEHLEDDTYIIWFTCCSWGRDYDIHDLSSLQELETVVEAAEGVVFRIRTVPDQRETP